MHAEFRLNLDFDLWTLKYTWFQLNILHCITAQNNSQM